ncbi:MAG: TRAP transporter large permease [Dehalococcoidia bacterium]|nr:TRAP transporter large permease [Dehalococcoidia bacterium]
MSPLTVGIIGIAVLVLLLAFRMSIGLSMGLVGLLGLIYLRGWNQGLEMSQLVPYRTAAAYTMSTIPLFVVMGNFAFYSGISKDLYSATHKWLGNLPGGLAMATTAGCAGFAAICGSSVATAVTMGTVSLPEMKRYKYDSALATGCIAAGGTLGILIPPSIGFIFYSMLTSESIGKLFIAGILPGILLAILFMIAIYIVTRLDPMLGPPGPRTTFIEKIAVLKGMWPVLILFLIVIGGMYLGVFTPTEAAGVGAFVAFVIMIAKKGLNRKNITDSLLDTGKMVAMCYLIILGATIFSYFIAFTRIPTELAEFVSGLPVPSLVIFAFIIVIYLFLGCIMDPISMIILTVPIFYPMTKALGFDPIWFGVIIVITMEMGMITPPVGVNVFVINGVAKDVPMETTFRGMIPFLIAMVVGVVILTAFPQIATFLPGTMY